MAPFSVKMYRKVCFRCQTSHGALLLWIFATIQCSDVYLGDMMEVEDEEREEDGEASANDDDDDDNHNLVLTRREYSHEKCSISSPGKKKNVKNTKHI